MAGIAGDIFVKHDAFLDMNDCINTGDITGENKCGTAGIVYFYGNDFGGTLTLRNCQNKGVIRSESSIGGIISYCGISSDEDFPSILKVQNCENTGELHGKSWGNGGIIGYAWFIDDKGRDYAVIDKCTNKGNVYAYYDGAIITLGGIVGDLDYSTEEKNSKSKYVLSNNQSIADVVLVAPDFKQSDIQCYMGKTYGRDNTKGVMEIKNNKESGKTLIK